MAFSYDDSSSESWFMQDGTDLDVVLSSKVTLVRNLASFPFPSHFKNDDSQRVQNIIFDTFNHFENPEIYQTVVLEDVDSLGLKILAERGLIEKGQGTALVTRIDGECGCLINSTDHVKVNAFTSGLEPTKSYEKCLIIDQEIQGRVQYAASHDFGYLTSSFYDAGSGMKTTLRLHLPSMAFENHLDAIQESLPKGFALASCFGNGGVFAGGRGGYFWLTTTGSFDGNEIDQLAGVMSAARLFCEIERKKRAFYADNKQTVVHNAVIRAYSLAKFSTLLEFNESMDIVSCLKWGKDMGIIAGVEDNEFNSLMYRLQDGHIEFLLKSGSFDFEQDVAQSPVLKIQRLRATIIKKAIEKIQFIL
ncbi:MAG: hypothetical protein MJ169_03105 [Treponema sp.]|nr:hypothetical protein [Treponema sp.]